MTKKQKTKIIYRTKPIPKENYETGVKNEIEKLEEKRKTLPSGFKGFLQGMAINKAISDKKKIFKQQDKIRITKSQVEYGKVLLEKEKIKSQLNELKQKNQVNFDNIYKDSKFYI